MQNCWVVVISEKDCPEIHTSSNRIVWFVCREQFPEHWRRQRLTHWCRVTHICVGNQRHQCQAGILSIEPLGTHFSEILTEIKKIYSRRGIWKCRLRNCGHFVSASMCLKNVLGHPMSISTIVSPMLMHWIDRCIETALWVWIAEYCLFLKIGDLVLTWPEISRHWQFTLGWMANFKKL